MSDGQAIRELLAVMARLRDPDNGCPWDIEQTYRSIAPHTVEEAYEVADVIERGEIDALPDELGDLLFQVVFYAQIGAEEGRFTFDDVVAAITDKLVRRHPHVFAGRRVGSAAAQRELWESLKDGERRTRGESDGKFADIPAGMPALTRAAKIQRRAARAGFDWPDAACAVSKLNEEGDELGAAVASGNMETAVRELGDVLFAAAVVANKLSADPEQVLRDASRRFQRRFTAMEGALEQGGGSLESATVTELLAAWARTKTDPV